MVRGAQEANTGYWVEGGEGNVFLAVILSIGTVPDLDVLVFSESVLSVCLRWAGGKL